MPKPAVLRLLTVFVPIVVLSLSAQASDPRSAEVRLVEEIWHSTVNGAEVYSGDQLIDAIQAAVDGLTPDRDWKETVRVLSSGTVSAEADAEIVAVHLTSYTVLDFDNNTVSAEGSSIIPVRAQDVQQIEIRNLRVIGNPRFGIFLKGCEDVVMDNIHISLGPDGLTNERGGAGIRSEGGDAPWSGHWNKNFVMNDIFVEDTRGHGVELWRTDGLKVGTITTRNTGYAGVLLNQTRNAHIELVDAYRANYGGGYAGFRVANNGGPNIVVDKVIAIECGRGVFTVSGSQGITIHEVDIQGSTGHGMLIEDTQDFSVNGGSIVNSGAEGVRINSRYIGQGPGSDHEPASNVTIQNLRISGGPWGIRETLPRSNNNFVLNNDLRGNENCYEIQGEG
ncbi:MAG: hypothetical protein JJU20_14665, partial [Opitutales bacterium]|nr:hypothetical protein [Opitutales bacterium]